MDAASLTGSLHSTPAAGTCKQAAACKALERGMREGMPAAATCKGVQLSPAKQQDLVQSSLLRLSAEKSCNVTMLPIPSCLFR